MFILFAISFIAVIVLSLVLYKTEQKQKEIVQINLERQQYNQQLEDAIGQLEARKATIEEEFSSKTAALARLTSSVDETSRQYEAIARKRAEDAYKEKVASLEQEYQKQAQLLEDETRQSLLDYKLVKSKIQDLEAKQLAYIQMKQREEEMAQQQDYYRLNLSEQDIQDIEFLRQAQNQIAHKEAIDKVIWEIYAKPAYDVLSVHLQKSPAHRPGGIYKITCITTQKAYIGQSVDIRERFRQHIKTALAHGSTQNKLYQEMKRYGINNFTFEIIEEVPREKLNEREVYWIDFYKTKEWGLNGTKGGS